MTHTPAEFVLIEGRATPKSGMPLYRCPVCAKVLPNQAGKSCSGRAESPAIVGNLDCIHRLERVGTVPCGTCSQTGREKQVSVYLCRMGGGQCCVLVPAGDVLFHDSRPVVCHTCPDRKPHEE